MYNISLRIQHDIILRLKKKITKGLENHNYYRSFNNYCRYLRLNDTAKLFPCGFSFVAVTAVNIQIANSGCKLIVID